MAPAAMSGPVIPDGRRQNENAPISAGAIHAAWNDASVRRGSCSGQIYIRISSAYCSPPLEASSLGRLQGRHGEGALTFSAVNFTLSPSFEVVQHLRIADLKIMVMPGMERGSPGAMAKGQLALGLVDLADLAIAFAVRLPMRHGVRRDPRQKAAGADCAWARTAVAANAVAAMRWLNFMRMAPSGFGVVGEHGLTSFRSMSNTS